jgi:uncharacterized protein
MRLAYLAQPPTEFAPSDWADAEPWSPRNPEKWDEPMTLKIKVIPGSPRTEFAGEMADGTLKIRVAAPADKGKANEALCDFLAKHYGVAHADVKIISGQTTTRKLVRISGIPTSDSR